MEEEGILKGLRNGKFGPPIFLFLFADDSKFFAKSDCKSVDALKSVLQLYCDGSEVWTESELIKLFSFLWPSLSCPY